jgi:hypothetical protein
LLLYVLYDSNLASWLLEVKGGLDAAVGTLLRRAFAAQIFCHPDVYHAWCELAVQNRFTGLESEVRRFLVEHQSMGLYLYGELLASKSRSLRSLARSRMSAIFCNLK